MMTGSDNERRPIITQAEREHAASVIARAIRTATQAKLTAEIYRLEGCAERIAWAIDFLADAEQEAAGRR